MRGACPALFLAAGALVACGQPGPDLPPPGPVGPPGPPPVEPAIEAPAVALDDLPDPPSWALAERWGADASIPLRLPVEAPGAQPFWLGEAQAALPGATLEIEGGNAPLRVLLNGEFLGLHLGDLVRSRLDATGRLRAGANLLTLEIAPSADEAFLARGGTSLPDRPPRVSLVLGPAARLVEVRPLPAAAAGALNIAVEAHGAPDGAGVSVELSLDGAEVGRGVATLAGGRAEVPVVLPADLGWQPWEEPPPVVQCVARLVDGAQRELDARRVRCALGSASFQDGVLQVGGRPVHVIAVKTGELGEDVRAGLGRLLPRLRVAGVDALETHGWVPDPDLLEAAEELGLGLVVLPRCPGAIPRDLSGRLDGDHEGEVLRPWLERTVPWMERSPAVVMWEREKYWHLLPGAIRPIASGGAPEIGDHPVSVANARYADRVEMFVFPEAPGAWIIEIIPYDPSEHLATPPAALNEFVRGWVGDNLGLVLPPPYTTDGLLTYSDDEIAALGRGLGEMALGGGERRGPALVHVDVRCQGQPCWGAPVRLEVEGLPPLAAATDSDGVAEFQLFWQGPARVRLGDLVETVELVPGRYGEQGWQPAPAEVTWSLPGRTGP